MKSYYLLFILLITSALATDSLAQTHNDNLKEAERQRALTNEQNKERDRQNLENNRPVERENTTTTNSTTSNSTTSDAERIAQEKYNEKLLKEREEIRKSQYRTPDQAHSDFVAQNNSANEKFILEVYTSELTKVGYVYEEASFITNKYRSGVLGQSQNAAQLIELFYEELNCLKRVKENHSTATFEILEKDISKLIANGAPIAALDCVELIESRFPDKKEQFRMMYTDLVIRYFYFYQSDQNLMRLSKVYFKLEDENPELYNRFKSKPDDWKGQNTPYDRLNTKYYIIINCDNCKYSGSEKRNAKKAMKYNKEREEAVCKKTSKAIIK